MSTYKFQTSLQVSSLLPRDAMVITPHFAITGASPTLQALADEWAAAMKAWLGWSSGGEIKVKVYDVQAQKPNYPQATGILNAGTFYPMTKPREIALCLSFYSGFNIARKRGRLYLPAGLINVADTIALRPTTAQMNKVGELALAAADLGGAETTWTVHSKAADASSNVTNWFVDDEWDIQRRRGLRSTTRTTGVTTG